MKRLLLSLTAALLFSGCFFDPSGDVENPYMETLCEDGVDNDEDGYTDCEDQDCCSKEACAEAAICLESESPQEAR